MTICVPVDGIKSTENFLKLVNNEGDVIVTQDGRSVIRCFRESSDVADDQRAREKLSKRMFVAKQELESGSYSPFDEVMSGLK